MRGGCCSAGAIVALLLAGTAAGGASPGPFRSGAKLTGAGEVRRGEFGWSVALSRDGRTAAVGAPNDDSPAFDSAGGVLSQGKGAVWTFARSGARWVQVGSKLVGRGGIGPAQFGAAVTLSGDGLTLLVGAPADGGGAGAAWFFGRRGSSWQPFRKVKGRPGEGFGASVALSGSGRLAVVGATGTASVYVRRGRSWRRSSRLVPPGAAAAAAQFGRTVAVSGDGSVALVGAPGDGGGAGAAWLFVRRGDGWRPLGAKLTGKGTDGLAGFGRSVALSRDGATALVGGPVDGNGVGAAWRFRVGRSSWSPDGKKLTATGETGPGQFGDSVALSANGDAALVGGALDAEGRGAAWSVARDGSSQRLRPPRIQRASEFGNSVALSGAGTVALVGSVGAADFVGAAWTFRR